MSHYSPKYFQSLPNLNTARDLYEKAGGDSFVDSLKFFFISHGMEFTFGLSLPHRHFNIGSSQRMVDYHGTSTPWESKPAPGMVEPRPSVWGFDADGTIRPYEFAYEKSTAPSTFSLQELEFVQKLKSFLDQHDATQHFGLCKYPGDDFQGRCEITMGNANINLKPEDYPENQSATTTAWFFSPPLWTRGCRCTCDNRQNPHGHGAHVITQSG